jgi:hypothetical protein
VHSNEKSKKKEQKENLGKKLELKKMQQVWVGLKLAFQIQKISKK